MSCLCYVLGLYKVDTNDMLCTWLHYRLSCFHYIAVTDKLHVLR